jgi:hypothetical protein
MTEYNSTYQKIVKTKKLKCHILNHKLRKRRDVKESEEVIMKGLENSQVPESCDVTVLKSMF